MDHFKVEQHSPTEWRIVNRHFGHGLLYTDKMLADSSCLAMNQLFTAWKEAGMETNPFPIRKKEKGGH